MMRRLASFALYRSALARPLSRRAGKQPDSLHMPFHRIGAADVLRPQDADQQSG
jgi:hypothetical protein